MGDGKSTYETGKNSWANTCKLAYGRTKLGDRDFRKTDDRIELESGGEAVMNVDWKLAENMLFSSAIEIFSNLKAVNQVVMRGNNTLTAEVSKIVAVIVNVQTINEPRISQRTQLKQSVSMGISYGFLGE